MNIKKIKLELDVDSNFQKKKKMAKTARPLYVEEKKYNRNPIDVVPKNKPTR